MTARGEYGTRAEPIPPLPVEFRTDSGKPADLNPLLWFVAACVGAAANKKHRTLGFVGGGVVGVIVDEALRRMSPRT